MKAKDLIKGQWYKFFPYGKKPWYLLHNGRYVGSPLAHIDDKGEYHISKNGQFGNDEDVMGGYVLANIEEINQSLPENKRIYSPEIY